MRQSVSERELFMVEQKYPCEFALVDGELIFIPTVELTPELPK